MAGLGKRSRERPAVPGSAESIETRQAADHLLDKPARLHRAKAGGVTDFERVGGVAGEGQGLLAMNGRRLESRSETTPWLRRSCYVRASLSDPELPACRASKAIAGRGRSRRWGARRCGFGHSALVRGPARADDGPGPTSPSGLETRLAVQPPWWWNGRRGGPFSHRRRPQARSTEAVRALRRLGWKVVDASRGDARRSAEVIGAQPRHHAGDRRGAVPQDKARRWWSTCSASGPDHRMVGRGPQRRSGPGGGPMWASRSATETDVANSPPATSTLLSGDNARIKPPHRAQPRAMADIRQNLFLPSGLPTPPQFPWHAGVLFFPQPAAA